MKHLVALAGGVGGAKLADGLYRTLPPDTLTVIVNTADDFDRFGLRVCPDADTVMYTLAGIANPATGWGIVDDTFATLDMIGRYGGDTWFRIGDRDFATDILRTDRLRRGETLSQVTDALTRALGVRATLAPMCDEPVATMVDTPDGRLDFQEYFVRRRHADTVRGVSFAGIETATLPAAIGAALAAADAIVFCPSNPIVSLGPILAVPGFHQRLAAAQCPKIGVSPIIGGRALKGPADQMLADLGLDVSCLGVAKLYQDVLDGWVIDQVDAALAPSIQALGLQTLVTQTVMTTNADRDRLAGEMLAFATTLVGSRRR